MHVVTVINTDAKYLDSVLDSLKGLHMHIDKVIQKAKGIEVIAETETETPDDLIYHKLYDIKGVKKIFAKVLQGNKHMYA